VYSRASRWSSLRVRRLAKSADDDAPLSRARAWRAAANECAACQAPCPASNAPPTPAGPPLRSDRARYQWNGQPQQPSPAYANPSFGARRGPRPHPPAGHQRRTAVSV
jgi:hypothetical protein